MYEQRYVSPESAFSLTKCVTPVKMRVKSLISHRGLRAPLRPLTTRSTTLTVPTRGQVLVLVPTGFACGGSGAHGRHVSGVG
jgi:hypothetical protein